MVTVNYQRNIYMMVVEYWKQSWLVVVVLDWEEKYNILNTFIIKRPYASKIAGTPIESEFDLDNVKYTFSFIPFTKAQLDKQVEERYNTSDKNACTTEIFVPYFHYGGKPLNIQVNVGECDYDEEKQTLYHNYDRESVQDNTTITIQLATLKQEQSNCNIM